MKAPLILLMVAVMTVLFTTADAAAGDFEMSDDCVGKKNGDCCDTTRAKGQECTLFCNMPDGVCDFYNPLKEG